MILWKEFEDKLDDYYYFILHEFHDNLGYAPILYGQYLFDIGYDDVDQESWYYCKDSFHNSKAIPLNKIDLDKQDIDDIILSYSEHHDTMPYFADYADIEISQFEPKFTEELSKYFNEKTLESYKHDISWLLDGYAIRTVMPKIIRYLRNNKIII